MDRESIVQLAALWGVEVFRQSDREVTLPCPFAPYGGHKAAVDRHPSFGVKVEPKGRSVCHCFACGRGGLLRKVAGELAEIDPRFASAIDFIRSAESGFIFNPSGDKAKKAEFDPALMRLFAVTRGRISDVLRESGITDADVAKWDLGFNPPDQRDIFPVFDQQRILRGMVGRRTAEDQFPRFYCYGDAKILTAYFYGEPFVDVTKDTAILVEGPRDTIKAARLYPNVLGLLGVNILTETRVRKLQSWFRRVIIIFDGDTPGYRAAFRTGLELHKIMPVNVAFLPDGKDPGNASPRQLKSALDKQTPWALVRWQKGGQWSKSGERGQDFVDRLKAAKRHETAR